MTQIPEPPIPELCGMAEIAAWASVSRQAVQNWRERWEDFPEPVVTLAHGPVYLASEVRHWLAEHAKFTPYAQRVKQGRPRRKPPVKTR